MAAKLTALVVGARDRPAELWHLSEKVSRRLCDFSIAQLATLAFAFSKSCPETVSTCISEINERRGWSRLRPRELSCCLVAGVRSNRKLSVDNLDLSHLQDLTPRDISTISWASSKLGIPFPLELWISKILSQNCTSVDLAQMSTAVASEAGHELGLGFFSKLDFSEFSSSPADVIVLASSLAHFNSRF